MCLINTFFFFFFVSLRSIIFLIVFFHFVFFYFIALLLLRFSTPIYVLVINGKYLYVCGCYRATLGQGIRSGCGVVPITGPGGLQQHYTTSDRRSSGSLRVSTSRYLCRVSTILYIIYTYVTYIWKLDKLPTSFYLWPAV